MWSEKPKYPKISKHDVKCGQRAHAKRRAKQRYGLKLNRADILSMIQKIHDREAICLCRESRTRTHYILPFQKGDFDGWMIAVYDRGKDNIATFMPRSAYFDRYIKLIDEKVHEELLRSGVLEYLEDFRPKEGEQNDSEA